MLDLRRIHLVIGIAVAGVFLLTGQYMDRYQDHLRGMADGPRMLYRSRHGYILMASLLNLGLGVYLKRWSGRGRSRLQLAGSAIIILATCLILVAFVYEPPAGDVQRTPFSLSGLILIALGTVTHVVASAVGIDRREN